MRDPRDLIVSWYFSAKYSHSTRYEPISKIRSDLEKLNFSDGLKYIIDRLEEFGSFEAQESWMELSVERENIKIFRYEDLANDNHNFLKQVFAYLNIKMPEAKFAALCKRNQFESKAKGRKQGDENIMSHYRKGIAGDWKNHFDDSTMYYFKQVTKDLLEKLGYPE